MLTVVEAGGDAMRTLRSAGTYQEYEALWNGIGAAGTPPQVDLLREVVVSVTIPDDACPPELVSFTHDGDVLTPAFVTLFELR